MNDLKQIVHTRDLLEIGCVDFFSQSWHLKDGLKEDVHYKVFDDATWHFLYSKYGGTDLPRLSIAVPNGDSVDHVVEVNLRKFKVLTFPKVRYITGVHEPSIIFSSRTATVLDLHARICQKLAAESEGRWVAEELVKFSRLWKFEGTETIDDAKQMLLDINSDLEKMPLAIQARILTGDLKIEDANIADNELIVVEMMISLDKSPSLKYVYAPQIEKRPRN